MTHVVTASDANRQFSALLRRARQGETVAITAHGETVAYLVPPQDAEQAEQARQKAALEALLSRARARPVMDIGPWTRDELYER